MFHFNYLNIIILFHIPGLVQGERRVKAYKQQILRKGETLDLLTSVKDYPSFREHYGIRNDTYIHVQRLSKNNTLRFQDLEYSLDGLQPFTIVSDQLKLYSNISISPLWQKSENGATIVVVKDGDVISYVSIRTKNGSRGDLTAITDEIGNSAFQERNNSEYITVMSDAFDNEQFKPMKGHNHNYRKTMEGGLNRVAQVREVGGDKAMASAKTLRCISHKTIEVAIAYDSSMCDDFSGDKIRVDAHIQAIVGLASLYYEPSCIKLSLVHIDGTCDKLFDPYAKIANSKSILEEFTSEWIRKKQHINRDVAHLFSGISFQSGVLGWAWKGSICNKQSGYGASWMKYTDNIALRASLFAHELGHNAGANHFGETCSNWLMAPCGPGLAGFSEESQQAIIDFLNNQRCLDNTQIVVSNPAAAPAPTPTVLRNPMIAPAALTPTLFRTPVVAVAPAPSPTVILRNPVVLSSQYAGRTDNIVPPFRTRQPNNENGLMINSYYSNPFELRSKAVSSHCLSVEDGSSLVMIRPCKMNSLSQQWGFNRSNGYIQNIGSGRCLIPSFSDIKVRLVVHPCPTNEVDPYKWRFSDGLIVKAKTSASEPELVIEAARAIKRVSNENDRVVLLPILSNVDGSKRKFQTWDRMFVAY